MPRQDDETNQSPQDDGGGRKDAKAAGRSSGRAQKPVAGQTTAEGDAIALLEQDHRKVEGLFDEFGQADEARKSQIVVEACRELIIHTLLEERIFYPAARQASTEDQLDEAQVEHDSAKVLILDLMDGDDDDRFRDAKFKVLAEQVKQHIKEEEAADGVFAKAETAGVSTPELAGRLQALKQQLQQQAQSGRLPEPQPVSLQRFDEMAFQHRQEEQMPSYRDRDEQGRYAREEERGYRSRGEEEGRGRYAGGRERDERGRFMSEDDERRGGSRGGRGQGGWFGDREGHAEAARRGWEERGYEGRGRSYRDDDEDERRYSSRGHERDRGQGGWFGDPEGHAEASRRGWEEREREGRGRSYRDDDEDERRYSSRGHERDRGQGGWFGDPEGHSEASRRGWEEREREGRGRYEERSYARGRDDDDDRRGGARGGWFGDPEGHSEASRRGWQDRR